MIRPAIIVSALVLAVMVTGLFELKYEVRRLDQEKARLETRIADEQEALRVLEAEWSYLNRPERIQRLNEQHLALESPTAKQIVPVDRIPWRAAQRDLARADRGAEGGQ